MEIYPKKEETYPKVSHNLLLLPLGALIITMNLRVPTANNKSYQRQESKLLHCVPYLSLVLPSALCLEG